MAEAPNLFNPTSVKPQQKWFDNQPWKSTGDEKRDTVIAEIYEELSKPEYESENLNS